MNPERPGLRYEWLAALGFLLLLVTSIINSSPVEDRQERTIVVFVAVLLGVGLFLWRLPEARIPPALLIPLGITVGIEALLGLAANVLAFLLDSVDLMVFGMTISLSLFFVLTILIWTLHAAWVCRMLWQEVDGGETDAGAALGSVRPVFLAAFLAMALGIAVTLLLLVLASPVARGGGLALMLTLAPATFLWNLITAGMLLHITRKPGPVLTSLREAMALSWRSKRCWIVPLLGQMVLLGWITYFSVSYQSGGHHQQKTEWHISASWLGGFPSESSWISQYCEAIEVDQIPLLTAILSIALTVVAIGVKRRIRDGLITLETVSEQPTPPEPYSRSQSSTPNTTSGRPGNDPT